MSNVPKLRFKEFSGEWNKERFGELCGFEQGVQVDVELQTKEQSDDLVRFIRIENYTQNSSDFRFIPKELAKKKSIDEKEIAIVRYGATAGFIGRGFSGVLANNLFKLKPNHKLLDDEYLYHYLKSYKAFHFFQSEMAGGAMPALSFGIVKALKLPYPSKQEQENIASFLTSVDTKIEQLTKKEQLLSSYKKGVMQKIFNQEIRFKKDDGSEFCEWEEKSLGEIFKRITTKNKENNPNVLTISAQFGLINQEKFFNKSVSAKDVTGYYLLENGDFAYNKRYSNGYPMGAIKRLNKYDKGVVSTLYICFRINSGYDSSFYEKYFNSGFLNRELHKIAQEGARNHGLLNISVVEFFNDIKIPVPVYEEQTKIANFLSSIDTKIEQVQNQLKQTKEFKKALLQQMFV